jgi:hypothetical protein
MPLKRPVIGVDLLTMQLPVIRRLQRPAVTIDEVLQRRGDLSTFIVHLTRDSDAGSARENLASIIRERTLRAGSPKGWATWERFELADDALETQRVVCFSETPLEHVHGLFAEIEARSVRFQGYGLAFPKMVARWMGINPVWYIDLSRARGEWRDWPIKEALNALVREAADRFRDSPVSRLTPFIEGMGSWPDGNGGVRMREFAWEREWRHLGDLELEPWWAKTLWLCPEDELEEFSALVGPGAHCIDPAWGLERIIGHLLGMGVSEMTPFAPR